MPSIEGTKVVQNLHISTETVGKFQNGGLLIVINIKDDICFPVELIFLTIAFFVQLLKFELNVDQTTFIRLKKKKT